ncbi:MAG: hypothetical protein QM817_02600 [Archangium sp.]
MVEVLGLIPSHLHCPGEWLNWADERGLPWLVRKQEATGGGKRAWHLTGEERAAGLKACDDAIEALEAMARMVPAGGDIIPPEKIVSPIGLRILRDEPRRFSALRLQTRRAVFVEVREALEQSQPRKPRDVNLDDLFAQILARPHDEEVRLVFADAIGASDSEYAEFIVTQIATRRRQATGVERDRLDVLHKQFGDLWANGVQHHASRWTFRSGFVEHVELTATTFLKDAAVLFQRAPIRHVTLVIDDLKAATDALRLPQCQQLAILALVGTSLPTHPPPLPRLQVLDLRGVEGARRDVRWSAPNLKHVLTGRDVLDLSAF